MEPHSSFIHIDRTQQAMITTSGCISLYKGCDLSCALSFGQAGGRLAEGE
jgi:hypothetical protein